MWFLVKVSFQLRRGMRPSRVYGSQAIESNSKSPRRLTSSPMVEADRNTHREPGGRF